MDANLVDTMGLLHQRVQGLLSLVVELRSEKENLLRRIQTLEEEISIFGAKEEEARKVAEAFQAALQDLEGCRAERTAVKDSIEGILKELDRSGLA